MNNPWNKLPASVRENRHVRAFLFFGCVASVLACLFVTYAVIRVFVFNSPDMSRESIIQRISRETPVYSLDGKRKLGSFFAGSHRLYVTIDHTPDTLKKAIVSSEDQNFYHHPGVDIRATAVATVQGLIHLSFHRGGSTITQQTVKIVFDDWSHSFTRKVFEAVAAFRLETLYSKDQILEFYLNQFHVTGNGNGVGVAARYYFDKDVLDLDLVESAFLAGAVQSPFRFNPFVKDSEESRNKTEAAAKSRKDYVLRRLFEDKQISEKTYRDALNQQITFKRGEFQGEDATVLDLVRNQLESKGILAAIGMESANDLSHAGLKVYTTIDADLQAEGVLAVRRNLSRLETILKGYAPESASLFRPLHALEPNEFYVGKVVSVERSLKTPQVDMDFGGWRGTLSAASLTRYAELWRQGTGKDATRQLRELLDAIKVGDALFVQTLSVDAKTRTAELELHRRPTVNGGLIALDAGEVRAAIPGFSSVGYDRATTGIRQAGSTFKTVVFDAALQLGWTILDPLNNSRQAFSYQTKFYYPRGAHESPFNQVSMIWAGAESENLAAVYLAAHLMDKTSPAEFRQVMELLGLLPASGESEKDYAARLAKITGVSYTEDGVEEQALAEAIDEMTHEESLANQPFLAARLRNMWWGRGYPSEARRLSVHKGKASQLNEQRLRLDLIGNNFQRIRALATGLRTDWERLKKTASVDGYQRIFRDASLTRVLSRFAVIPTSDGKRQIAYFGDSSSVDFDNTIIRTPLTQDDIRDLWGHSIEEFFGMSPGLDEAKLAGYLPLALFDKLAEAQRERLKRINDLPNDSFKVDRLAAHHDFRIAVGLHYLVAFSQAMGVRSHLEPVLSFPLGTSAVSMSEIAMAYQTMATGKVFRFFDDGGPAQINWIQRIEDDQGRVLFQASKGTRQLIDPEISLSLLQILRATVTHGTAGYLQTRLTMSPAPSSDDPTTVPAAPAAPDASGPVIRVPSFGKTGTTDDFSTGLFAGLLPYPTGSGKRLDPANSFAIVGYAGFDKNKPMVHGGFQGFGGAVALPAWSEFARGIIIRKKYSSAVDALDLSLLASGEWPMVDSGLPQVVVDLVSGKMIESTEDAAQGTPANQEASAELKESSSLASHHLVVRIPGERDGGRFIPRRVFRPYHQ